jgi:hypothetical protein
MFEMWNAVHYDLERDRDLLLDLLRRDSRPLRDDLNVVIGDVRIGLHRQGSEGDDSPEEQQDRDRHDKKAVVQRKINGAANHGGEARAGALRPLE